MWAEGDAPVFHSLVRTRNKIRKCSECKMGGGKLFLLLLSERCTRNAKKL